MTVSHIVQRNQHFDVVTYSGCDPIAGRERRRWHPADLLPKMPVGQFKHVPATVGLDRLQAAPVPLNAMPVSVDAREEHRTAHRRDRARSDPARRPRRRDRRSTLPRNTGRDPARPGRSTTSAHNTKTLT